MRSNFEVCLKPAAKHCAFEVCVGFGFVRLFEIHSRFTVRALTCNSAQATDLRTSFFFDSTTFRFLVFPSATFRLAAFGLALGLAFGLALGELALRGATTLVGIGSASIKGTSTVKGTTAACEIEPWGFAAILHTERPRWGELLQMTPLATTPH